MRTYLFVQFWMILICVVSTVIRAQTRNYPYKTETTITGEITTVVVQMGMLIWVTWLLWGRGPLPE